MATQTKVKWAKLRVGILALAAMVILTILIFLITGKVNFFDYFFAESSSSLASSSEKLTMPVKR